MLERIVYLKSHIISVDKNVPDLTRKKRVLIIKHYLYIRNEKKQRGDISKNSSYFVCLKQRLILCFSLWIGFRSQVYLYGVCGGWSGLVTGLTPSRSVFLCQCFPASVLYSIFCYLGNGQGPRERRISTQTPMYLTVSKRTNKFLVLVEKVLTMGRSRAAGIATRLRAGQFWVQTPVDSKFLRSSSPALGNIQTLLQCVRCLSSGYSALMALLTTHPHLKPRLKKEHSYNSTPPSVPLWHDTGRTC